MRQFTISYFVRKREEKKEKLKDVHKRNGNETKQKDITVLTWNRLDDEPLAGGLMWTKGKGAGQGHKARKDRRGNT